MLSKQEIRQLGDKQFMEELQKSRRDLLRTKFEVRNGASKETHVVKNLRRYIAQLQTLAKEMSVGAKAATGKTDAAATAPVAAEKKAPVAKKTTSKKTVAGTATAKKTTKAPAKKRTKPATKK